MPRKHGISEREKQMELHPKPDLNSVAKKIIASFTDGETLINVPSASIGYRLHFPIFIGSRLTQSRINRRSFYVPAKAALWMLFNMD